MRDRGYGNPPKFTASSAPPIRFVVKGRGQFPMDMLRYDTCWPATEPDSRLVETGMFGWADPVTITLRGLKVPTEARWASFGWTVEPML